QPRKRIRRGGAARSDRGDSRRGNRRAAIHLGVGPHDRKEGGMAEVAAVTPQVFTRRASGLVRVMSPYSAFIYNILTMGVIFPWTYIWAPTAFQGSNLVLGITFAFLFELPIALAYAWLATALPRSGGDYVFQSRVFGGGLGFTVVFAFFVVWILQWVALSGWLLAALGIAPTFLGLGVPTGIHAFTTTGNWAARSDGIIIISL